MKSSIAISTLLALTCLVSLPSEAKSKNEAKGSKPSTVSTEVRTAEYTKANTNTEDDLTLSELQAFVDSQVSSQFVTLDDNSDAVLSLEEFINGKTSLAAIMATEIFNLTDSDGTSGLSEAEFFVIAPMASTGEVIRNFAEMDKDRNLLVSLDEYLSPRRGPGHR